ncbi:ABC transporter ATP-binding protein [Spirosoma daeguense]
MNDQQSLLRAQALTIGYKGRQSPERIVAESLELELLPGQLVCLLGPNGAGKSTLMRTLAGLQPQLDGQITIDGQSVATLRPADVARKLSLVLSDRIDAGTLRVCELVALGRTPHTGWLGKLSQQDNALVQQAMMDTDTLVFANRRLQELSDGERQKVMLARALAQDTPLILLDEPTAHLDLPNRVEMMRLLHQLTRLTKKAILLSTHELDLALQMADKLWLLNPKGQLSAGTPEDLVLTGAFEATFDKSGFSFDRATGTFRMHSNDEGPTLTLTGDEQLLFWTRRAIQREGFRVNSSAETDLDLSATYQNGVPVWQYQRNGNIQSYYSIADLLVSLRAFKRKS